MARRATALQELRVKHSGIPLLVVDTGNALAQSDSLDHPLNPWIVRALEAAGTDVILATLGELRRLRKMADEGKLPPGMKSRYISSVVDSGSHPSGPDAQYWLQSIANAGSGRELRVGVLAVSPVRGPAVEEISCVEPMDALRRLVPVVERQSDCIVLLARLSDEELAVVARTFPAIDVIINGSATREGRELPRVGNTVVVESSHNGIALGILELELDDAGRLSGYRNQFMPLVPTIPDSEPMVKIVDQSRQAYSAYMEAEARRVPAPVMPSVYAGAGACADCHPEAYKVWEKSRHAHAIDVLKSSGNLYNDKCLGCHVTGLGARRGFVNMLHTPELGNVQCEACHGAASDHGRNPEKVHPGVGRFQEIRRTVRSDFCLRCHTEENSPNFNFDTYWPKIKH